MIFADYVEDNKTVAVCGGKLSLNDTIALTPQWSAAPYRAFSSEARNCVTVQTNKPVFVMQQLVVRWYSTAKKQMPGVNLPLRRCLKLDEQEDDRDGTHT